MYSSYCYYFNLTELRQELAIWQKAASSLSSYSKEEGVVRDKLLRKCKTIFSKLKDTLKYFKVDVLPAERYTFILNYYLF